jgi:hypothetical protein
MTSLQVDQVNPKSHRRLQQDRQQVKKLGLSLAEVDSDQTVFFSERHCFDKDGERFSHVKPQAFQAVSGNSGLEQGNGTQIPEPDGHPFVETRGNPLAVGLDGVDGGLLNSV